MFTQGPLRRPTGIVKAADAAVFFVPRHDKLVHRPLGQRGEVTPLRCGHGRHCQIGMALGAPRRLGDDLVDDAEADEVASGQPQGACRRLGA